jgi:xylulokinase
MKKSVPVGAQYILVHDLGTTGNKAIIFDEEGKVVVSNYRPFETYYPRPTWVEQSPMEWWKAVCDTTRLVLDESKISPQEIACVSFSGQMLGAVPVDKEGNLLKHRTQIWCDARSGKQAEKMVKYFDGWKNYYRIMGTGWGPEILPIHKFMWIKENEPKIYEKSHKFLEAKGFIEYKLTGKFATDYGDASITGYFDTTKRKISDEIIEAAGIDPSKIPDLHESHDVIGYVTDEAAKITGLNAKTPVVVGSGDGVCACVGAGVIKERMCYTYIGSANWAGVCTTEPIFDIRVACNTVLPISSDGRPGHELIHMVSVTAAGGVTQDWFRDGFCDVEKHAANQLGVNVYDLMNLKVMDVPTGSEGLLFLPYLRGGSAPFFESNDRGAFIGIVMPHEKKHFMRAMLEGVSLNCRWLLELFESAGIPTFKLGEIRAIGGGAKNKVWMRIYADVLGVNIAVMESPHEATGRGAACMGGMGVGIWKDYKQATETLKIEEIVKPDKMNHEIYNKIFVNFKAAYKGLSETCKGIAEFQAQM